MGKNSWKIIDLAEANRGYLLLDDKKYVVWVSYKLRIDLLSAGIRRHRILGRHFNEVKNRLCRNDVKATTSTFRLRETLHEVELAGLPLSLADLEFY